MFWVYILASRRSGTLYTGMTDDIDRRIWEHREHILKGFTAKHDVTRLFWLEPHDSRESAFTRERRIKEWKRAWKLRLIGEANPEWRDLYDAMFELPPGPLNPANQTQATT